MFANPTTTVYQVLPPPQKELSEVLAFVFMGPAKPTKTELQRIPLLVRRNKVANALTWLKLNHKDYQDLNISKENLSTYPEYGIPIEIQYMKSETEELVKDPLTMSVHDADETEGTDSGPCPFVVHGLSGQEYADSDVNKLKAFALYHLHTGGKTLGIGSGPTPQSIYNNPSLFPSMFPWLFPYGYGGFGNEFIEGRLSEESQIQSKLQYYDKRFQKDLYFPMIAFNIRQIKNASTGSFILTKRKNFKSVVERLMTLDSSVIKTITQRMIDGEKVIPVNAEETKCFSILNDIDHVSCQVQGSLSSKKNMRNEIWSLISFLGTPVWFITLSPADHLHPISLYFADTKTTFTPEIRSYNERYKLIAENPVAAAKFFNFMVEMFLLHILGVKAEHTGIFGDTAAYYGTVEQQGRLTLHLHLLLWIRAALTPQQMRDRIMNNDSQFQQALIEYLESVHRGEFLTGGHAEVKAKVPHVRTVRAGIHDIVTESFQASMNYQDPTQTLPDMPPVFCNCSVSSNSSQPCKKCLQLRTWWSKYEETVDDILLRSNIHTCKSMYNDDTTIKPGDNASTMAIKRSAYRGCQNKEGECVKRFPRDTFPESYFDSTDGHLNFKKLEPMMNTITAELTYAIRANTDVTSLMSGTSIKAVVAYVSDYITKQSLKTHQIFSLLSDILEKNAEILNTTADPEHTTRTLLMQLVNSLQTKLEIGSPLASLYLLGLPDHYVSHSFIDFWWQTYVAAIQLDLEAGSVKSCTLQDTSNNTALSQYTLSHPEDFQNAEKVVLKTNQKKIYGTSQVDNYRFRPSEYESMSLYEWIQTAKVQRRPRVRKSQVQCGATNDVEMEATIKENYAVTKGYHTFQSQHPQYLTHEVYCDSSRQHNIVPNFKGGSLPRKNQGDEDFYFLTMLCLFKPWRNGSDLKLSNENWSESFTQFNFTQRQKEIMNNVNLKYECYDARDDFHQQLKKTGFSFDSFPKSLNNIVNDPSQESADHYGEYEEIDDYGDVDMLGPQYFRHCQQSKDVEYWLQQIGWLGEGSKTQSCEVAPKMFQSTEKRNGLEWDSIIKQLKQKINDTRLAQIPSQSLIPPNMPPMLPPQSQVSTTILAAAYFMQNFTAALVDSQEKIESCVKKFTLNNDQERAFRIIANHISSPQTEQLKMYLGGMGGTGKSQVIKALKGLFEARNEHYRFICLAPTGTAAAILNGATYHSVLGIRNNNNKEAGFLHESASIKQVQEKLRGVEYIFLDEISMINCHNMYQISAKLAAAKNQPEKPFGGLNIILAGDFAQIPPVIGPYLYHPIEMEINPRMKPKEQEQSIGKSIWQQVTKAVILKENMRQTKESPQDTALRKALENMRYGKCNSADIQFLQSRTTTPQKSDIFLKDEFRNISIITAWNVHKDTINQKGSVRYASDTNQELVEFFSIDSIASSSTQVGDRKRGRKRTIEGVLKHGKIDSTRQNFLWNALPSTTNNHIPGKLSLCIGLPIIIKQNYATELCITNGQEGTVFGWQENIGPQGQRVLDTLFVKLKDPPQNIILPDLPKNVVPLSRSSQTVKCTLPNDTCLTIKREQVMVLPNFAITDYVSQGKTRIHNLIHCKNLKNHHAYYTAFSRSSNADGIVLLDQIDPRKIDSGVSGYLRQEFRELLLLNEITELQYTQRLDPKVTGETRNQLIRSYFEHKGEDYIPADIPKALMEPGDKLLPSIAENTPWQLVVHTKTTRKRKNDEPQTVTNKKPKHCTDSRQEPMSTALQGMIWNAQDWSCPYDTIFTIILNLWQEDKEKWSQFFTQLNRFSEGLIANFVLTERNVQTLEDGRNIVRQLLHGIDPESFPYGQQGGHIDVLAHHMFGTLTYSTAELLCLTCHLLVPVHETFGQIILKSVMDIYPDRTWKSKFKRPCYIQDWVHDYMTGGLHSGGLACSCEGNPPLQSVITEASPLIYFNIFDPQMNLNQKLTIPDATGAMIGFTLRAVTYMGGHHFTCRFITSNGSIHYHDGITCQRNFQPENCNINDVNETYFKTADNGSKAMIGVLYIQD
ncbi:hypothetical protein D9758_016521 [Tetrapyrgos nigripes]|uniref:ATP-dependent DNA helicase n=1 Tax=Tetrapyrgos nigripes TaxID=182062 RepID=A0A8H5FP69_9AGAR|nr:hypothetical protein D9758_016521 [Tetrapyrgos nigripes]